MATAAGGGIISRWVQRLPGAEMTFCQTSPAWQRLSDGGLMQTARKTTDTGVASAQHKTPRPPCSCSHCNLSSLGSRMTVTVIFCCWTGPCPVLTAFTIICSNILHQWWVSLQLHYFIIKIQQDLEKTEALLALKYSRPLKHRRVQILFCHFPCGIAGKVLEPSLAAYKAGLSPGWVTGSSDLSICEFDSNERYDSESTIVSVPLLRRPLKKIRSLRWKMTL